MTTKLGGIAFIERELFIWDKAEKSIGNIAEVIKKSNARVVGQETKGWKLDASKKIWVKYKKEIGVKE